MQRLGWLVSALFIGTTSVCWGQDAAVLGRDALAKAMAYAAGLDAASVDLNLRLESNVQGVLRETVMSGRLAFRGARETYLQIVLNKTEGQAITDGVTQWLYLSDREGYVEIQPPWGRAKLVGVLPGGMFSTGTTWLGRYLENDAGLLNEASEIQYVGDEDIFVAGTGTPCGHVRLTYPSNTADVWVHQGDAPLLQRVRLSGAGSSGGPGALGASTVEVTLSAWETNGPLPEGRFTFVPPEGTERVDSLAALGRRQPKDPLIGQLAPELTLDLLDGGRMNLVEHRGKDVVILDFWASWCAPCRMVMPIIERVAQAHKDQGVALYAVNVKESSRQIQTFLDKTKHSVRVALDRDGRAALRYGATHLPRVVLVDRAGLVRAVYRGYSQDLESEFTSALKELLAESAAPVTPQSGK